MGGLGAEEGKRSRGGKGGKGGERMGERGINSLKTCKFFPNGLIRFWAVSTGWETNTPLTHTRGACCILEFRIFWILATVPMTLHPSLTPGGSEGVPQVCTALQKVPGPWCPGDTPLSCPHC